MGDLYPVVKVAAVQAASVFLDREGSTEKACGLIREAGRNGAKVIGFPEGFIPAHPIWYHHHAATGAIANRLAVDLFKNAVEIPGPEIDALCARGARCRRLCRDRRLREASTHARDDVQLAGLHCARRHLYGQAPEDHADGRRAARAYGRVRRHAACVLDELRPDERTDLRREFQSARGVRDDGGRIAHSRHELAQSFPDQRRSDAPPGEYRLRRPSRR